MIRKITLLGACISGGAWAQTGPGLATTATAQTDQTAAPRPADSGQLGDIVVTASRRSENIQKSNLAIQALSAEAIRRAGVTRPEDLSTLAAGVSVGTGGNNPQTYIRGVGNYATDAYAESAVAYNIDGVYIARPWATRALFFDLDRIEVVKGPQGTLYGRNASGGAINIITARPTFEWGGFGEIEAGNYGLIRSAAALNIPVSDTLALRASGQIVHRDGYLTTGYDDDKSQAARLQLLWKPNSDFSLLLNGGYQHIGGKGAGSVAYPYLFADRWTGASDPRVVSIYRSEPGSGSLLVTPADDGFLDIHVYSISAEATWNFGPATLTLLPAYRDSTLLDRSYVPGFQVNDANHARQTSMEARLSNDIGRLKWVVGGYFFDEIQTIPSGQSNLLLVEQGVNTQRTPTFHSDVRSYAAFGQGTYSVTDRFRLTGGLRYTYERKTQDGIVQPFGFLTSSGGCASGSVFDASTPTPPLYCRTDVPLVGRLTYNSVTYKAGVEYDLGPRSMAYATVSSGFKSGGFYAAPSPNTFRPEKLQAIDAGIKNRLFDNRLQLNVEAFYWRYKDHQESHLGPTSLPGFFTFITENAGRAKSYGADLDLAYQLTPVDRFNLKVQYNKTRYDSFTYTNLTSVFGAPTTGCKVGPLTNGTQTVDCSGFQLVRSPTWSGTAGYDHRFDLADGGSIDLGGRAQFSSGYYLSIDFLPTGYQDAYVTADADLTYTAPGGRWSVAGYVHNLTNQAVATQGFRSPFISAANPQADQGGLFLASLRPPRTFGGRVRVNF